MQFVMTGIIAWNPPTWIHHTCTPKQRKIISRLPAGWASVKMPLEKEQKFMFGSKQSRTERKKLPGLDVNKLLNWAKVDSSLGRDVKWFFPQPRRLSAIFKEMLRKIKKIRTSKLSTHTQQITTNLWLVQEHSSEYNAGFVSLQCYDSFIIIIAVGSVDCLY